MAKMAEGFFGSIRAINSAKLGPPRKDGYIQIDVLVDTNPFFPRGVVNIPSYDLQKLSDVLYGKDWETWEYINSAINKATRGDYNINKEDPGKISELISPAGILSYRLIINIIPRG
jgi:hypothetical protein